ncbi:MAG: winged helix DNA-binding protein [Chloroflexi bacterium]|nr:winged helix DNA-binding protein [Chloroflexota bacterium]
MTRSTAAAGPTFQSREAYLHFVRQVCPDADLTSVILFGAVHRASNQLIHIAEKRLDAIGLTWPKFRLLMLLMHVEREGRSEGLQPSELSERQNISRNTASALIGSLEEAGYISRELHETDHRKFMIRLTAKGRKVVGMQMANHIRSLGHSFDMLAPQERERLLGLLQRLSAGLELKS